MPDFNTIQNWLKKHLDSSGSKCIPGTVHCNYEVPARHGASNHCHNGERPSASTTLTSQLLDHACRSSAT